MSLLYPDLGAVCSVAHCRCHDLLPATCASCGLPYCAEHLPREEHSCSHADSDSRCVLCGDPLGGAGSAEEAAAAHAARCRMRGGGPSRRAGCDKPGCGAKELVLVACRACGGSYCVPHRLPEDHACASVREPRMQPRQAPPGVLPAAEAGRPLWHWAFANTPETDDGDTGLPQQSRFGLRVFFAPELRLRPRYMFFNSAWKVGRAVDHICRVAGVPNRNNQADSEPLRLFLLMRGCPELPAAATLGELAGQGPGAPAEGMRSGSGVMLRAAASLPPRIVGEVPRWLVELRRQGAPGGGSLWPSGLLRRGGAPAAARRQQLWDGGAAPAAPAAGPGGAAPAEEASWIDRVDDRPGAALRRRAPPPGLVLAALWLAGLFLLGWLDPRP
eukprot:TRINITY_DN37296_c0_g1_i2.p2 TRINITY_DN37296_c0_g1~~TRINITY_DN37296_c0_g1_i2.p2  ORF type:complete len:420 (+),score=122.12 TRINITY_DN37296_c0_g1_i2:101-1261(+)